jgi:cytochrome b pre-mRNA-processing protein 3
MFSLFKRNPYMNDATRLYDHLVEAARRSEFYSDLGVPDTFDGRFEMMCLHMFAIEFRLKNETAQIKPADQLAQALFDRMFIALDRNLREGGVGDLGVPKKIKRMMIALNGRCFAYTAAIGPDAAPDALNIALRRNVYGTVVGPDETQIQQMEAYLHQLMGTVMSLSFADIQQAAFIWPQVLDQGTIHEAA